jgi:hypothetical protein
LRNLNSLNTAPPFDGAVLIITKKLYLTFFLVNLALRGMAAFLAGAALGTE